LERRCREVEKEEKIFENFATRKKKKLTNNKQQQNKKKSITRDKLKLKKYKNKPSVCEKERERDFIIYIFNLCSASAHNFYY